MNFFSKKETIIQNLTYIAIMAAINVVFVLLAVFLPYLYLILLFALPLTSTFVMLFCKKRYFPIYAVATIGLCFLASINSIGDTFFYIIPSILTGAITGFLIEKKLNGAFIIISTSLIHFLFSLATLPLIKTITGVELMESVFTLFKLNDFAYKSYLTGPFIYFTSLAQMAVTYFVLKNEIKKIGFEIKTSFTKIDILLLSLYEILMFGMTVLFAFIWEESSYTFLILGLVPSIVLLVYELSLFNKIKCIIMGIITVLFPFVYALIYPNIPDPLGILIIGILFILINIPTFCSVFAKSEAVTN